MYIHNAVILAETVSWLLGGLIHVSVHLGMRVSAHSMFQLVTSLLMHGFVYIVHSYAESMQAACQRGPWVSQLHPILSC